MIGYFSHYVTIVYALCPVVTLYFITHVRSRHLISSPASNVVYNIILYDYMLRVSYRACRNRVPRVGIFSLNSMAEENSVSAEPSMAEGCLPSVCVVV